jgi:hypothetical protein
MFLETAGVGAGVPAGVARFAITSPSEDCLGTRCRAGSLPSAVPEVVHCRARIQPVRGALGSSETTGQPGSGDVEELAGTERVFASVTVLQDDHDMTVVCGELDAVEKRASRFGWLGGGAEVSRTAVRCFNCCPCR